MNDAQLTHPTKSLEQQVADWARAIIADQAPVEGGFAPAPVFPVALVDEVDHE